MFCNECGASNPDNAKFCNECGAKFVQMKKENDSPKDIKLPETIHIEAAEITTVTPETNISSAEAKSIDNMLRELSVYSEKTVVVADGTVRPAVASAEMNPIDDPYWDDILPEINAEIMAIPKENIIKIAGCFVALFLMITWLIYML